MKPWACAACHESDVPRYNSRAIICELCRDSAAARGLAWCTGVEKPHRVKAGDKPEGRSRCRACDAKLTAARYAANREHYTALARAAYWANREANIERNKHYRQTHPDARRQWYARNREKELAGARARYRRQSRAAERERQRLWRLANPGRHAEHNRRYRIRKKLSILRSAFR